MPEIDQNLAHYSIVEKIGKGGMGEVYRAKDQKLGRDVAIKVLPEEFMRDADRVARFQREAKLLASLNHPNIAAIYGLEESGGTSFLVLELKDGKTMILEEGGPLMAMLLGRGALGMSSRSNLPQFLRGRSLEMPGGVRNDIVVMSMEGGHATKPLLNEKFHERSPRVSPDGKLMAYVSDESGQSQVCVRPFPQVDSGKLQVSRNGGIEPGWSHSGRELFYRSLDSMMAVAVDTEPTLKAGVPKTLFSGSFYSTSTGQLWDLSNDDQRFLMIKGSAANEAAPTATGPRKLNVILNWTEELKQRVPAK